MTECDGSYGRRLQNRRWVDRLSLLDVTIPSSMYRIEQPGWFLMLVKSVGSSYLNKASSTMVEHTDGDI